MTDRRLARERRELLLVEHLRHEPHVAHDGDPPLLGDGDPGRLLTAVLEREQPEVREPGHLALVGADAEDATHQSETLPGAPERIDRNSEQRIPADLADAA